MSTVSQVIARVDAVKPNAFSPEAKMKWLSDLDGKIAADVFLMGIEEIRLLQYTGEEGLEKELLVTYPHEDIYDLWLQAMIDAANGEYNLYQNTMQIYNEAFAKIDNAIKSMANKVFYIYDKKSFDLAYKSFQEFDYINAIIGRQRMKKNM